MQRLGAEASAALGDELAVGRRRTVEHVVEHGLMPVIVTFNRLLGLEGILAGLDVACHFALGLFNRWAGAFFRLPLLLAQVFYAALNVIFLLELCDLLISFALVKELLIVLLVALPLLVLELRAASSR